MLYHFDFEKDIHMHVLSLAFQQFDVDFFKEILGSVWEFYYERNFWSGIYNDEENKELNIVLKGLVSREDELIRQKGWSMEEISIYDVSKIEGCYIGQVLSAGMHKNTGLQTDQCSKYILFIPLTGTFFHLDIHMVNHYKINMSCRDFEKIVLSYEYPLMRLFHLTYAGFPQNPEPYSTKRFHDSMMNGTRQVQNDMIIGTGFAGMRLLLEDMCLFVGHGHPEWMSHRGRYFYECLEAIRIQRLANFEYLRGRSTVEDDTELKRIVEWCRREWNELPSLDAGGQNLLAQLGRWFKKVIDTEEKLFALKSINDLVI